jgi:hypothetical protein
MNCKTALLHFRHRTKSKLYWIDAVCIDQSAEGLEKRSKQVQLMGEIYGLAYETMAWLRSGDPSTKRYADDFLHWGPKQAQRPYRERIQAQVAHPESPPLL